MADKPKEQPKPEETKRSPVWEMFSPEVIMPVVMEPDDGRKPE